MQQQSGKTSPWRRLLHAVRDAAGKQRDEHGIKGSINWLRKQMELRNANPNVVRNIIYRDKGRLSDKRVLFDILAELWRQSSGEQLHDPEIQALVVDSGGAEAEILRPLGREKRQAFRTFVSGVRAGGRPKLLVTGRPGSGKTLLIDYAQEALEAPPRASARIVRLEFVPGHVSAGLVRLGSALGLPQAAIEGKLAKISPSGAFAVQADAQSEVARLILDEARLRQEDLVLLAHLSRSSGGVEHLGGAPLRLNTLEVPRVAAPEWLWFSLFEPLSRLPHVCMLVSITELPTAILTDRGGFEEPVRLKPPTAHEARRFVRARLPQLQAAQQEELVRRAGRSYEDLRTLILLTEARDGLPKGEPDSPRGKDVNLVRLASLVHDATQQRLADFLTALATLTLPPYHAFSQVALRAVREFDDEPSSLELAFLDPAPSTADSWRAFSRQFTRLLQEELRERRPEQHRHLNLRASEFYRIEAELNPRSDSAGRYVQHLFEAREWRSLSGWMERCGIQQPLIGPLWAAAQAELRNGPVFERIALRVANHYVRLGSYEHPGAIQALAALSSSQEQGLRAWALVQRAEGAVLRGKVDRAEALLAKWPPVTDELRETERALVQGSIARWRGALDEAADLVEKVARPRLPAVRGRGREGRLVVVKAGVWAGMIAKDRGDLELALREFTSVPTGDELIEARVAFQKGDVLSMMGRFDAAMEELDHAVELARLNQAPSAEQARYLTRRARLLRMRGELDLSLADLSAARETVGSARDIRQGPERAFHLSLCDEEYALTTLAQGAFEQAIIMLDRVLCIFADYGRRCGIDTGYRSLRATQRLAHAYLARSLSQPYLTPYARTVERVDEPVDLAHARSLLASVQPHLAAQQDGRLRWSLRRQAYLLGALLAHEAVDAAAQARFALTDSRVPYHDAEGFAHLASATLRSNGLNDLEKAFEFAQQGLKALAQLCSGLERSDLRLKSWLIALQIQAALRSGLDAQAGRLLANSLADLSLEALHEPLLRIFANEVEGSSRFEALRVPALMEALTCTEGPRESRLRLPDQLVARWRSVHERRADTAA